MISVHAALYPSSLAGGGTSPLTPSAAAIVSIPTGQRLRVHQRLAAHVYVADYFHAESRNATQLVVKLGRMTAQREGTQDSALGAPQELRVARQLQAFGGHRNIVRVVDACVDSPKDLSFVVMEYCNGGDLFSQLVQRPEGRFSERESLRKLSQIARGVQYLHQRNIAHRDLSLENVLIQDGECKICDFGLSGRADILSNQVVGKTQYAAPEVIHGDLYDPVRTDMWSLGIMLFMMLTGSPLVQFASPSCPEFLAIKVVGVRGVLQAWGMEALITDQTVSLLSSLLSVNPERRMASAKELLTHPALQEQV